MDADRDPHVLLGRIVDAATDLCHLSTGRPSVVYQAPSGFKLMPKDPTDAMLRALEAYYAKWQSITGTSDDDRKADCWSALHAYRAMYEAADRSSCEVERNGEAG